MDRISSGVLEKICSLSSIGRYTVISEEEFFESFPEDAQKNDAELKKALKNLVSEGYADLKYSDGEYYCVSPLKKYEAPAEPETEPLPQAETNADAKDTAADTKPVTIFLAAFSGGALGSLLISLIFAFI